MSEQVEEADPSQEQAAIARSAYVWNTAGGLLMAFQSVIMLMVLTRVCDVETAGVFSIAYANANLFLNVGKYGMRTFQVSDLDESYSFGAYAWSRALTSLAMVVAGAAYLLYAALTLSYTPTKTLTIFMMLLFKVVDAVEDVFGGHYQQHGRLDLGARVLTLRLATTIVLYAVLIVVFGALLPALTVATAYTALFFVAEVAWIKRRWGLPARGGLPSGAERRAALSLLKECLSLFLAAFLIFYIGNAPKYAIDAQLDDVSQAYYGYIAMPVFVVNLLSTFIYNPILASLADLWNQGRVGAFVKRFGRQVLYIAALTALCDAGALVLGVPVLNLLYNTELSAYRADLIILVTGGGLMALASLFTMGITIQRRQDLLVWGYAAVALAALLVSNPVVAAGGIDGAAWLYFCSMGVLALWFAVVFLRTAQRARS